MHSERRGPLGRVVRTAMHFYVPAVTGVTTFPIVRGGRFCVIKRRHQSPLGSKRAIGSKRVKTAQRAEKRAGVKRSSALTSVVTHDQRRTSRKSSSANKNRTGVARTGEIELRRGEFVARLQVVRCSPRPFRPPPLLTNQSSHAPALSPACWPDALQITRRFCVARATAAAIKRR